MQNRRDFMKKGLGGLLTLAAADAAVMGQARTEPERPAPRGAMERLNVAVIGVNGRGKDHIGGFAGQNNCVVTHICDADSALADATIRNVAGRQDGVRPRFVQDIRRLLEDNTIDIVSIATPNHWHALASIWAMQAGKDVYVEKPVSHNVWEGRRIVDIARRTNKICQAGTQIRSATGIQQAVEFLRAGTLGRVQVARGLCYKRRNSIGNVTGEGTVPASVNYDLWCGPGPRRPLNRLRLHYDWHWTWDFGNGDLGNQGIHQMDVARWGLGKSELAPNTISLGGRFGYTDDGETANTQIIVCDYPDSKLIFEVRGLPTPSFRGASIGNVFHCADGYLVVSSYSTAIAYRPDGEIVRRFNGARNHYTNFVEAVRNRRREHQNGEILEGHLSSALCHMGNISYRLGRPAPLDPRTNALNGDAEANDTLARMEEHLGDNRINLRDTNVMVGRRLTMNPSTERFSDDEANTMLTREYRAGFVVPARD